MASIINTNIMSLNAQRNLNRTQGALQTSMQRLSSGLRINSAKDDAAGMAISERFSTQIRGLSQAARNANDGISLSQTAEGATVEITNNLQRIRELAVQSANASNSAADRAALDQEVQQRLAEIDRIASESAFNGHRILDGTFGSAAFQVGANVGETISIGLSTGVKTTQIGQIAIRTSSTEVDVNALSGTGTIKVGSGEVVTIGASVEGPAGGFRGQGAGSAYAKAAAINAAGVEGLSVMAENNIQLDIAAASGATAGDTYDLHINGEDIFVGYDFGENGDLSAQQITDAINAQSNNTGVTASLSGGTLRLSAADGRDIIVGQANDGTGGLANGTAADDPTTVNGIEYRNGTVGTVANAQGDPDADPPVLPTDATAINGGTLTFSAKENIVMVADGVAYGFADANITIARDTTTISSVSISTVTGANDAMRRIDAALSTVNSLRADFGAIQNRFESTIANLETAVENMSAARSRIRDADFAKETAELTRAQILQQAGTAMLSQANAAPQNVLALLQ